MQPIRILTPTFQLSGEIDDYESLQFIRRFRKPGEFELHINANKNLTDTLQEDNLIVLSPRKVGVILIPVKFSVKGRCVHTQCL